MWLGSDTKTAVSRSRSRMSAATRPDRLERRPALVLGEDRRVGDVVADRVGVRRSPPRSSGRPRPCRRSRPGSGATPVVEQLDRVVEPGREHRRGTAVVLGRAHARRSRRPAAARRGRPGPRSGRRCSPRARATATSPDEDQPSEGAHRCLSRSAAVALLVLRARPAPARVVAADPRARSACSPARAARRAPLPPLPPVAGWSPSDSRHVAGRRRRRQRAAHDGRPGRPGAAPAPAASRLTRGGRPVAVRRRAPPAPLRPGPASGARPPSGGGCCWTVTRKIVDATPWRMRPRSSSYSRNASRRNSLSGSCWA